MTHLLRGQTGLRSAGHPHGCIATIGNFDGIHLGHRAILRRIRDLAAQYALPSVLVTFEPSPQEFFLGDRAPARLTRIAEKLAALAPTPPDHVAVLHFTHALAGLTAAEFIDALLVDALRVRHLVVGEDFRFGRGRSGDLTTLAQAGERAGFTVEGFPAVCHAGERVSSTRIRELLASGALAQAAALLGRPYRITGRVAHGNHLGRTLGFPTLNLPLRRRKAPLAGVYAVHVHGLGPVHAGVANLGIRPTLTGHTRSVLETHLFDWTGDAYGRRIEVEFHAKLRDERRFDSLDALKEQIAKDCRAARALLEGIRP